MRPDVDVAYMSPKASLADVSTGSRLRVTMQAGPVSLIPRRIDAGIADALDALDPDVLPELDVSGTVDRVCREIGSAVGSRAKPETPVIAWLRRDVADLAGLFASATGAERLRVHFQVVTERMCPRFHVDNVAYRLVTTYRGPGTEWLLPRAVSDTAPGEPVPVGAIRRMERGTVAIMRGGKHATLDRPGVLHRSPAVETSGAVRLLLAIDEGPDAT